MSSEIIQLLVYQVDDFQELISGSSDNFSKTKFHQMLLDITKKKLPFCHATHKSSVEGPLTSIKQLKSLASSMKNGRRRTLFTTDELTVMNQHLNQLEYLLELKSYFDDRIFAFILKITSQWQTTIENMQKSKMADRNRKCLEDEFTKVNGCSMTEDDAKEITDSVNQIKAIESRWANMIDCSELNLAFFEKETKEEILTQTEKSPFELICHVIPDQVKKVEKCVELSKKWLKAASSKRNNQNTFAGMDSRKKISEAWMKILEVDESILADEQRARRLQTELKRLANKEARYVMLKDDYKTTAERLEQVCTDYRNGLLERHSLNRKIQQEPGFSEEAKAMSKLYEVGDRIEASHKDMKMLKYSFALLQEDMALEASMRSSYIRFEENVKEMLSKLETQIEEKKQVKRKLDKELILLKANSKWFESNYGKEGTQESIYEEEVEEWKERRNNEKYSFRNMNISADVESEPEVMSCNQKLAETDKNGRGSRIPILRNNSDFPETSQSTHAQLKLKLPGMRNPEHKAEGSGNQRKTRIPKLIH